jgi:hypothetical protein
LHAISESADRQARAKTSQVIDPCAGMGSPALGSQERTVGGTLATEVSSASGIMPGETHAPVQPSGALNGVRLPLSQVSELLATIPAGSSHAGGPHSH